MITDLSQTINWGPLQDLVSNAEVSEILVNSHDEIWFEKKGLLNRHTVIFETNLRYRNLIEELSRLMGCFPSLETPFAQGALDDLRLQIVMPPAAKFPSLAIRKRAHQSWTLEDLWRAQWASEGDCNALVALVRQRKNILIVGGTSSGKTTAMSALLACVTSHERVVILEDTAELQTPNPVSLKLLTRFDPQGVLPEVSLQDLMRWSLRLRPDRLVVGEIRGAEAKDLLLAISTGHSGSMATLHAGSAHESLLRLEMLVQMGAPQWDLQSIRRLIQFSIEYVVVLEKNTQGLRRLEGIYRIASREDFGFSIEKLGQDS